MTAYVILASRDDDRWAIAGRLEAHGARQAIRAWLATNDATDNIVLVAVPARSWKPIAAEITTVRQLTLKDAG